MKNLFSAFPLLKKKRFYLFVALIVLICAATGFLYLLEDRNEVPPFEEEKPAIEEALSIAQESLDACEEEDRPRFLQEKAFFESALKFQLSPWSSDFAYEGLSLYAALSIRGGNETTLQKLETILTERDKAGLLALCEQDPELPDLDARLILAEDGTPSAGRNSLLYDICLLEESLASGEDRYFAVKTDLTEQDAALLERLLQYKEKALLNGKYNPVPANKETLLSSERFAACLLSVLLLAVAGYGSGTARKRSFWLFLVPLIAAVLLCAVAFFLTTLLFAPGTVEPEPLLWGGSIPFFPALFLRLLCRELGSLPLMLFCFYLRGCKGKPKAWRYLSFLPILRFLLQSWATLYARLLAALFFIGDLAGCIFPDLSAHSFRPASPWMGVVSWLLALVFGLFLLLKKEQKIAAEKQELSLEKQIEL